MSEREIWRSHLQRVEDLMKVRFDHIDKILKGIKTDMATPPEERITRLEAQMEQNTAGIRDLIVIARASVEAAQSLERTLGSSLESSLTAFREEAEKDRKALHAELASYAKAAEERSKDQDERMNALIQIVDELIRHRRNGNGKDKA